MSGYFFVFDGLDDSGKSTALASVATALSARGRRVLSTREPGGSPLAEQIRHCMLTDWAEGMPVETELLLVFAARAAHLKQTVIPALQRGEIVLCDRFVDSSYVYQGCLGGVENQWLQQLEQRIVSRQADRTFLFDLDIDTAITRMQTRGHEDRFDRQGRQSFELMRRAYNERLKAPGRVQIDASQTPEQLVTELLSQIEAVIDAS